MVDSGWGYQPFPARMRVLSGKKNNDIRILVNATLSLQPQRKICTEQKYFPAISPRNRFKEHKMFDPNLSTLAGALPARTAHSGHPSTSLRRSLRRLSTALTSLNIPADFASPHNGQRRIHGQKNSLSRSLVRGTVSQMRTRISNCCFRPAHLPHLVTTAVSFCNFIALLDGVFHEIT